MDYQENILRDIETRKAIIRSEKMRKEKPTSADLRETLRIFDDFGMRMSINKIPRFSSAYELEKWRVKKIMEFLDEH